VKNILVILLITLIAHNNIKAQPTKMKATINHIAIFVYNLRTSTDFYQNVIGLDTIPEPFHDGKHTWMQIAPKTSLHLIEGAATITEHPKYSHTCFSVGSVTDFIRKLNDHKIPFEDAIGNQQAITNRVDGVKQIYFKDPDGYWIEINDARE
jgi:lactoylglutathione lyase